MTEAGQDFAADFLVVGSGFGGSVSALRLAEKGYTAPIDQQRSSRASDRMPMPSATGARTGERERHNVEEAATTGGRLPRTPEDRVTSVAQAAAAPSRWWGCALACLELSESRSALDHPDGDSRASPSAP